MNRIAWVVVAVTAVGCLAVGALSGWFGHRAYMINSLESAFEGAGEEIIGDLDAEEAEAVADEEWEEDLPEAVALGETASDGFWDIEVTAVERKNTVSGSYSNARADEEWEFLILNVELTNASDSPQMVDVEMCEVMDADGATYAYHSDASYALDDDNALYEEPNPGQTVALRIPFEIPEGQEMDRALLTGTYDNTGVAVIDIGE